MYKKGEKVIYNGDVYTVKDYPNIIDGMRIYRIDNITVTENKILPYLGECTICNNFLKDSSWVNHNDIYFCYHCLENKLGDDINIDNVIWCPYCNDFGISNHIRGRKNQLGGQLFNLCSNCSHSEKDKIQESADFWHDKVHTLKNKLEFAKIRYKENVIDLCSNSGINNPGDAVNTLGAEALHSFINRLPNNIDPKVLNAFIAGIVYAFNDHESGTIYLNNVVSELFGMNEDEVPF